MSVNIVIHSQKLAALQRMIKCPGPVRLEYDEAMDTIDVYVFHVRKLEWTHIGMMSTQYEPVTRVRAKKAGATVDAGQEGTIADPTQSVIHLMDPAPAEDHPARAVSSDSEARPHAGNRAGRGR